MEFESILRKDIWKSIEAHYVRKDYTECLRDSLFFVSDFLREHSGEDNLDGTKLIEKTLLGNDPVLSINKNETETEKNIQKGIAFILKGLMLSVRNPISHEKCTFSRDEAEGIILHLNYIMNQLDHSGGITKIDDVLDLIYDEDFTATQEYAELLIKEIPKKKRYELIEHLFLDRINLHENVLHSFIDSLFDSLSQAEKTNFISIVNRNLLKSKDDYNLMMYAHYFMDLTYKDIDRLAQLRIEDLVMKSVKKGKRYEIDHECYITSGDCDEEGRLATYFSEKLGLMSNQEEIKSILFDKMSFGEEADYVLEYFINTFNSNDVLRDERRKYLINIRLKHGKEVVVNWMEPYMEGGIFENETMIEVFKKNYDRGKSMVEERNIPF